MRDPPHLAPAGLSPHDIHRSARPARAALGRAACELERCGQGGACRPPHHAGPGHLDERRRRSGGHSLRSRARAGELKPFTLPKPYRVEFSLRPTYAENLVTGVDALVSKWGLEKTGARSYRYVTSDAKQIAYLVDAVEKVVLP